jgi:hypothetical protein
LIVPLFHLQKQQNPAETITVDCPQQYKYPFGLFMRPMHNLSLATKEIAKGNYGVMVHNQEKNKDVRLAYLCNYDVFFIF